MPGRRSGVFGRVALWFGLVCLAIVGLVSAIVGPITLHEWFDAQDSLEPTMAEVIDVTVQHSYTSRPRPTTATTYIATVRFETRDGATIETTLSVGPRPEIGDEIEISYDLHAPSVAYQGDGRTGWIGGAVGAVLGPLLLALVVYLVVMQVRARRADGARELGATES